MLFNSYIFILVFLPITILIFFILGKNEDKRLPIIWLVFASLFYYGWWNPIYLILIISSIGANYFCGRILVAGANNDRNNNVFVLVLGVTLNLILLGYFKYANFFVDNINSFSGSALYLKTIVLPLGISFFTFEQIAYLVDTYRGDSKKYSVWHYCTFVSFFPQLIAGPIAHHKEIIPQLEKGNIYKFNYENFSQGLTIFFIGLFKKVMIADKMGAVATPIFDSAESGYLLTFFESWMGILAYTFQIYFDFSGYSDMAVGLGRMFGIKLPFNFNSPYKATSIIDFWRRWHITLSKFLREYLYIPLGGNKNGTFSRYKNLIVTMLLGGLWHGAGWNFVVWGALHGFYLVINHSWRYLRPLFFHRQTSSTYLSKSLSLIITFLAVIVAWVFFRAETFKGAVVILEGMAGINGVILPNYYQIKLGDVATYINAFGVDFANVKHFVSPLFILELISLFAIVLVLPNSQDIVFYSPGVKNKYLQWAPNLFWLSFITLISIISLLNLSRVSEFLYYQF